MKKVRGGDRHRGCRLVLALIRVGLRTSLASSRLNTYSHLSPCSSNAHEEL